MLVVFLIWQIPHCSARYIGIYMHYSLLQLVKKDTLMPLAHSLWNFVPRFMSVLVCLVFSVLSTIEEYKGFANETLFWMVGLFFHNQSGPGLWHILFWYFHYVLGCGSSKFLVIFVVIEILLGNMFGGVFWGRVPCPSLVGGVQVEILPLNTNLSFLFIISFAEYFSINQQICLI